MKNLPLLIGTLIGTVVIVLGIVFFFSKPTAPTIVDQSKLITSTAHSKGPADAPVTIVEFSDFQCPACRATDPLLRQITQKYPDKVRLVYRHYPLVSIHEYAQLAAQASEVAADNNKFWEYHDLLFDRQDVWSSLKSQDEVKQKLADYAQELGIDKASFLKTIDSDRIKSIITDDVTAGGALNIQATPTLYVNGQETAASQLESTVESRVTTK